MKRETELATIYLKSGNSSLERQYHVDSKPGVGHAAVRGAEKLGGAYPGNDIDGRCQSIT